MSTEKEVAARKAAAAHPADLIRATFEFARLTAADHDVVAEVFDALREEMLTLLPGYRHPTNDELSEHMIFIGPDLEMKMRGYEQPQFISELEAQGTDPAVMATIKAYARDAEIGKIELAEKECLLSEQENKIVAAKNIYKEKLYDRPSTKNTAATQAIGLSKGVRPPSYDKRRAYIDYVHLVRKGGMARRDAVHSVMKKHEFTTYGATVKALHGQKRLVLQRWQEVYPTDVPKISKILKGLVPQDRV